LDVVRGASAGTAVAHALSRVLRFVGKILYEIMLEGFLCLTKPSKRAVRGAFSPHPCVHAGVFLRFMDIISTVSKPLRYSLLQEYVCATGARGLRPLRCGRYALTCAPSLRSAYVRCIVTECWLMLFKSVQSTRQIP
jgi:hypothetical protein